MPRAPDDITKRLTRIETRVTKLCIAAGMPEGDSGMQFCEGVVTVPSQNVTLNQIAKAIPEDWNKHVTVRLRDGTQIAALDFTP